ncbi:MAG: hypothetical protein A2V88_10580 [Elusimicrobia bacterium RBG_16_66_12]|nr:MAG: hypothetical protein A2V88_10580 [Elusimicrobia bacterium RBG_16_66_12]
MAATLPANRREASSTDGFPDAFFGEDGEALNETHAKGRTMSVDNGRSLPGTPRISNVPARH